MIIIGCDHGGYELKQSITEYLKDKNIEYKDAGCYDRQSCDYPDIAKKVCDEVLASEDNFGILVCGTGIGMSIAANKIKGIRAALCSDYFSTKYTRLHNNSNVMCLGERVIGKGLANELVEVFLKSEFEGERHSLRVEKIRQLDMR